MKYINKIKNKDVKYEKYQVFCITRLCIKVSKNIKNEKVTKYLIKIDKAQII